MIDTCYGLIAEDIFQRLSKIRLLMLDVDGTLTDGGIYLNNTDGEYKKFFTKDGLGTAQLQKYGDCTCAVITGRSSVLVQRRCDEIGITHVLQGVGDKAPAARELIASLGLKREHAAAIGDDLNDLPMFSESGFVACPSDAHPFIQKRADLVMHRDGGRGAVREICDLIMMARGFLKYDGGRV